MIVLLSDSDFWFTNTLSAAASPIIAGALSLSAVVHSMPTKHKERAEDG